MSVATVVSDDLRNEVSGLWKDNRISDSDVSADRELQAVYRDLSRRSLYFLTKGVLKYDKLVPKYHKPYADFVQDLTQEKVLTLMPRGTYKTTIGTIGFAIWYLLNDPNKTILLVNQNSGNAERMLFEIEQHLDGTNLIMAKLFPEYIRPGERFKPWNNSQMVVPCREIITGMPSVQAVGRGARLESLHFHAHIFDDLIGREDQESPSMMSDAILWYDYSPSLFVDQERGIMRMHGTRYTEGDIYDNVMKDRSVNVYLREALDEETGKSNFPEILSADFLRELRDRNFKHFMSQYQNNPLAKEALEFPQHLLQSYRLRVEGDEYYAELHGEKFFVKDMDVIMGVDPAASGDVEMSYHEMLVRGKLARANNCITVWGLHGDGLYFLLDMWAGRGVGENPELQIAEQMADMVEKWRGYLRKGVLEAYGAQAALITIFNMLMRDRGTSFPIEEIGKRDRRAKKVRIRSYIGPHAYNREICVRPHHDLFMSEFGKFPQGSSYDTLDASVWCFAELKKPKQAVKRKVEMAVAKRRFEKMRKTVGFRGY